MTSGDQSTDVQRAADFYTKHLGFRLEHQQLPAFATVSLGGFKLLLSGRARQARGRCQMGGGRRRADVRIVLHVTDLAREIERLKKAGLIATATRRMSTLHCGTNPPHADRRKGTSWRMRLSRRYRPPQARIPTTNGIAARAVSAIRR